MTLIEAETENEKKKTRILFAVVRKKIWCKIELKQNLNFSKKVDVVSYSCFCLKT